MEGGPAWPVAQPNPGSGTGILPVDLEKPAGSRKLITRVTAWSRAQLTRKRAGCGS